MKNPNPSCWMLVCALLAPIPACHDPEQKLDTGEAVVEAPAWTFEFALATESAVAGQGVAFEAELVRGDEVLAVGPDIRSDLEPGLSYDNSRIEPTVAGLHTVYATIDHEGEAFNASASLDVSAGEPAEIDLMLQDYSMVAGHELGWSVALQDAYGNELHSTLATVSADDGAVVINNGSLSCTTPGTYTVTATAGAASDDEVVVVTPGVAASIDLQLSDTDIEVNETVSATVTVLDTWGNETDDAWNLSVEADGGADPSTVVLSGNNLTFEAEGIFTVLATAGSDAGQIQDRVGPLLVDSSGPVLDLHTPQRGAWSEATAGSATGDAVDDWSGIADLVINEQSVTVGSDGAFSTEMAWDFGMNLVRTVATDGDGNTTEDLRAVLAGVFLPYRSSLSSGLLARLNEGGLDTLGALATELTAGLDINSFIPDPVYDDSYEYCLFGSCTELYAITLSASDATFDAVGLDIDPQPGTLLVTFTVYDPAVDWSADGMLLGSDYTGDGTITADSIAVSCSLTPYVQDGQIHATVSDVAVTSTNFQFDFDSWLYEVIGYFGVDIPGMIQGYMEDAIIGAVQDQVPALIEQTLQDLELSTDLAIMGASYTFAAVPEDIVVDDAGLTLALETSFTTQSWTSAYTGLGSLYAGYTIPVYGATPGMLVSVSLDFLNQALYAFWGAGLLNMNMGSDEIGLDPSTLAMLFPDLESLSVTTEALLPPVVLPGASTGLLELQLGDLLLTLYDGDIEVGNEWMEIYVSALADLSVTSTDAGLSPTVDGVQVFFDVVYPDNNSVASSAMEELLSLLVPMLLPSLTDAITEIPIPAIQGFTLDNVVVSLSGAESGYLDLGGDLVAAP